MRRYNEIQERLDKGESFQAELLKLLCDIADTLLYIRNNKEDEFKYNSFNSPVEPEPKKRGRPLKKGWNESKE